jgi:hypothetical protein
MSVFVDWAAKKGIQLATDKAQSLVEQTIEEYLNVGSIESLIYDEIKKVSNQLSLVLDAPYKEALMHFREGNIDKCRDKLITAINYDELNLPAWRLYLAILRTEKKYELVLDYGWELLHIFGFRPDLVAEPVYEAYVEQYFKQNIMVGAPQIEVRFDDNYYAKEIWCSPGGFVARCKTWFVRYTKIPFFPRYALFGFAWREGATPEVDQVFELRKASPTLHTLTARYAIVDQDGEYIAYRLRDGFRRPNTLSFEQCRQLFPHPNKRLSDWHTTIEKISRFKYGGMKFIEDQWTETGMYLGQGVSSDSSGGSLKISFAQDKRSIKP